MTNTLEAKVLDNLLGGPELNALCERLGINPSANPLNTWMWVGLFLAGQTAEFSGTSGKRGRGRGQVKGTGEDINYKRSVVVRQIQYRHKAKTAGQEKRLSIPEAVAIAMDEKHPLFRSDDIGGLVSSVSRGNTITRAVIAKMQRENPDWFDESGGFKPPAATKPDPSDYVIAPTRLRGLLDSLADDDDQLQ